MFDDENGNRHTWIIREDGSIYEIETGEVIDFEEIESKINKYNSRGLEL